MENEKLSLLTKVVKHVKKGGQSLPRQPVLLSMSSLGRALLRESKTRSNSSPTFGLLAWPPWAVQGLRLMRYGRHWHFVLRGPAKRDSVGRQHPVPILKKRRLTEGKGFPTETEALSRRRPSLCVSRLHVPPTIRHHSLMTHPFFKTSLDCTGFKTIHSESLPQKTNKQYVNKYLGMVVCWRPL